jgi:hypothetical protein
MWMGDDEKIEKSESFIKSSIRLGFFIFDDYLQNCFLAGTAKAFP